MDFEQATADRFLSVIAEYKGIIYKVASFYCRQAEDRKDLVQEIIYQLWRSFPQYNEQYKLSTWMYKVALNVSISFYRKDKRRQEHSSVLTDSILDLVPDNGPPETEQHLQLLQQLINELPPLERALMILYLEEKSYREIAEILGLTETNTATKISRVKDKLKQKFRNY
ncbi:RNA polymerase sigma factor [Chitinophaga japonensis]|uniref:RNA polymerase sigma-70 factor (ECF subfamily) n=1 Tax=Chitinophaga japonensis TaxID=104662 RepID=A0A562SS12_CHIJA|nr:RNA polymerase sigma factor [Chitinophaga japonensis]TWI84002.1 RNA polymerase sigma-70 factor (ECF subfamily) [Chitinophaga japonensis]